MTSGFIQDNDGGWPVAKDRLLAFVSAVFRLNALRTFTIRESTFLDDDWCEWIGAYLSDDTKPNMWGLHVSGLSVTDVVASAIARAMGQNTHLEELRLDCGQMGVQTCRVFAE